MIKYLINLLTTSTTVVVCFFFAQTAIALPISNNTVETSNTSVISPTAVSLNLVTSSFQTSLTTNNTRMAIPHFGCSCTVCSQITENSN